jgi:hypothetical protein
MEHMEFPMRAYGLTLFELFLTDILTLLGWLMIGFAIVAGLLQSVLLGDGLAAGMLIAATVSAGMVLLLASAGIRQNRATLDLSFLLLAILLAAPVRDDDPDRGHYDRRGR